MAKHNVSVTMPQKFVLSKDVVFEITSNGVKLGELLISKGNIDWKPSGNSVNKHRMTWERFAQVMEEAGRIARVKKL